MFTLVITVFFTPGTTSTEYNDDHILAIEEFLGDILRSNAILPSCSDDIFRSGDMFANFSFELVIILHAIPHSDVGRLHIKRMLWLVVYFYTPCASRLSVTARFGDKSLATWI